MIAFDACYYDGRTSGARPVRITVQASGSVRIEGDGVRLNLTRSQVRLSSRLGNAPRYLHLPDGGRCEALDHQAMDKAFPDGGLVHTLERRWSLVAAAAVVTVAFLWLGFTQGVPFLARHAAHSVPPEMELQMGEQALATLDRHLLMPTALTGAEQERANAAFTRVSDSLETPFELRLEIRDSDALGANALALPAGIIVLTDEMVALTETEEELMGVVAHEAGHIHHRHVMRSLLQNSVTAVLIATLLGDVTSVTGLAASIPTFLVERRYSRQFELEADRFALDWMHGQNLDPDHLANILTRLSEESAGSSTGFERYLSTHPSTRERIDDIRQAQRSGMP